MARLQVVTSLFFLQNKRAFEEELTAPSLIVTPWHFPHTVGKSSATDRGAPGSANRILPGAPN